MKIRGEEVAGNEGRTTPAPKLGESPKIEGRRVVMRIGHVKEFERTKSDKAKKDNCNG